MAYSPDSAYNSRSRKIYYKVDIYFDGRTKPPLEITRDNYLISSSLLEEATAGDTPFNNVSSNEVSFTLDSPQRIFNPTNASSPYYNKMRRGVPVGVFIRCSEDDEWSPLGNFYVTDWQATATTATVVADDVLYNIFGDGERDLPVRSNYGVANLYKDFFELYDIDPEVDASIIQVLPRSYLNTGNKDFLTQLSIAFFCICNVNHDGRVNVLNLRRVKELRQTITDEDQIVDVKVNISLSNNYDAATLVYHVPQESAPTVLYSQSAVKVPPGILSMNVALQQSPVSQLRRISFDADNGNVSVEKLNASRKTCAFNLVNYTTEEILGNLEIAGRYLETVEGQLGAAGDNTLEIESLYIQSPEYAEEFMRNIKAFIQYTNPVLTLTVRGNPNWQIGDKIRVLSARHRVDFTGILMRQSFRYDGGLTSDITLLNHTLVEAGV